MALSSVRQLIKDIIEPTSLKEFNKAVAVTDKLFEVMERATEPEVAFSMCMAWSNSVLDLARTEARLLNSVLSIYLAEIESLVDKLSPLVQRREDARGEVYELRGPTHDVRPLPEKYNPDKAEAVAEAREYAKVVSVEVLSEMRPIQAELDDLYHDVGAIKRSLRVLAHFVDTRFPVPHRSPQLRGQSSRPSGADPLEAFAEKYAASIGERDKVDAQTKAIQAARAHPVNRFDRDGQVIVH